MAVDGELVVAVLGNTAALTSALAKSEAELKGFRAAATSHGNVASNARNGVRIAARYHQYRADRLDQGHRRPTADLSTAGRGLGGRGQPAVCRLIPTRARGR